jgi:hypothetical protein
MVAESFDRSLRAFVHRTPFRPFTVELVSGQRFEVGHPEALVYRNGVAVYFSPDGGISLFDHGGVSRLIRGAAGPPRRGISHAKPQRRKEQRRTTQ